MGEMLTYRQAARRVGRSMRAVRYWRARGMPMSWEIREGQKVRVVEESVLLAWWRERMKNDPVYQINLRKRLAEADPDQ
ncbi:hypothetical protein [Microbacterium paraoxydans]|uniref:Helix-turn-helix domain-containing protein n=2 Tax=Microbacterium paraoxydans TaxID=199592 RepID=A0A1H1LBI7_9MICO|nr:hypothetical protein [Microbacterium paraoxydans]SDR71951.1 hypothetical protein SAMN04489809_0068 [Microbacterium paraoxydans]